MLRIKNGVYLASFKKLDSFAFMKGMNKAPDITFLLLKVVAICGVFGSCRRHEMCDINREGSALIINIRPLKTEKGRKFAVVNDPGIPYVQLFNKYLSLRPEKVPTDRVFLKYTKGKCTKQVVGINTFGKCPSSVARFLNLPNCEKYTGYAFRRTSATIMANSGMSVDELKRQIGWKSSTVAAGYYIEESTVNKLKVSERIAGVVNRASDASTSSVNTLNLKLSECIASENESSVASASSISTTNVQMMNVNKEISADWYLLLIK